MRGHVTSAHAYYASCRGVTIGASHTCADQQIPYKALLKKSSSGLYKGYVEKRLEFDTTVSVWYKIVQTPLLAHSSRAEILALN